MLAWEGLGCQLYSNAVVASVTKDFKFCDKSTKAVVGCHIGVTSITYYPKIKTVSCHWLIKPDNLVRLRFAAIYYLTSSVTIFYVG